MHLNDVVSQTDVDIPEKLRSKRVDSGHLASRLITVVLQSAVFSAIFLNEWQAQTQTQFRPTAVDLMLQTQASRLQVNAGD